MTPPPKHAGDGNQWDNDAEPADSGSSRQPIGEQPSGYQTTDYQSNEYRPTNGQTIGYQQPGYSATNQQPQDGYQTAGYQSNDYQINGYQTNGYRQSEYSASNQRSSGCYPPPAPPQGGYAYDPRYQQPAGPPANQQPKRREINPWSVAAIIVVLFIPIVGIILACVAYKDSRRDGVGEELAKAAFIIGVAVIVLAVLRLTVFSVGW